jgi:hypothetical protein
MNFIFNSRPLTATAGRLFTGYGLAAVSFVMLPL